MKGYLPTSYASAGLELIRQGHSPDAVRAALIRSLTREGKIAELSWIVTAMIDRIQFGEGQPVTVTTAHPLAHEMQKNIEQELTRLFSVSLSCIWKVDPQLVGGIVVRHEDDVINYSVITLLAQLYSYIET